MFVMILILVEKSCKEIWRSSLWHWVRSWLLSELSLKRCFIDMLKRIRNWFVYHFHNVFCFYFLILSYASWSLLVDGTLESDRVVLLIFKSHELSKLFLKSSDFWLRLGSRAWAWIVSLMRAWNFMKSLKVRHKGCHIRVKIPMSKRKRPTCIICG